MLCNEILSFGRFTLNSCEIIYYINRRINPEGCMDDMNDYLYFSGSRLSVTIRHNIGNNYSVE